MTHVSALNQDEAIKAQEHEIEREIAERNQLIGDRIPLDVLLSEYPEEDHVYRSKIHDLKLIYGTMRKSRPDGNCFFRAFGFSLFNSLLNDEAEIQRLMAVGRSVRQDLHSLGFSFTVDDFHEAYQESLTDLREGKVTTSQQLLDQIFNENSRSDYLVVFLRLVTSSHLQKHADFFQAFIEDGMSVKEFCAHEVEPMYKESDHIHVIAITTATGVGVRINYLDRGGSADKINVHDFPEGVEHPQIHLLYRPGHYDVLYPRETATAVTAASSSSSSSKKNGNKIPDPVSNAAASAADSFVTSSSPPGENSSDNNVSSNDQENGSGEKEKKEKVTGPVSGSACRSHSHVSSSSPASSSSTTTSSTSQHVNHYHNHHNNHSNSCEGVSSSKNPRLDPGVTSSAGNNDDSNEPSTTS